MVQSIDHSKKVIADIGVIIVDAVQIAKHLSVLTALPKLYEAFGSVKEIVAEAPLALPELKDLSSDEAGQLAAAAYDLVKKIISSIVG